MSDAVQTQTYRVAVRAIHWAMAAFVLGMIALGFWAVNHAVETPREIATKTQLFSIHKTVGILVFLMALLRVGWTMFRPKPRALNSHSRAEVHVAAIVHWVLLTALILVPLSGWVRHASLDGFAPVFLPFGDTLPFVPKSAPLSQIASNIHFGLVLLLCVAIALHIGGALKHHFVDRDITLLRMLRGAAAGEKDLGNAKPNSAPFIAVALVAAVGATAALLPGQPSKNAPVAGQVGSVTGSHWVVETGNLAFEVVQYGKPIAGAFPNWRAKIEFDPAIAQGESGAITIEVDLTTLEFGELTSEARSEPFFAAKRLPLAVFDGQILTTADTHTVRGTLNLKGASVATEFPVDISVQNDIGRASGVATFDRRDFDIGMSLLPGDTSLGFGVRIPFDLTATPSRRTNDS